MNENAGIKVSKLIFSVFKFFLEFFSGFGLGETVDTSTVTNYLV